MPSTQRLFAVKTDEDGFTTRRDEPAGRPAVIDGDGNSDENVFAGMLAFKKLVPGALLELMYIQKNDQDETAAWGGMDLHLQPQLHLHLQV